MVDHIHVLDSTCGAHEEEILEETNDDHPLIPNVDNIEDHVQRDDNFSVGCKKIVKHILLMSALIIFCVGIAVLGLLSESKGMEFFHFLRHIHFFDI